MPFRGKIPKLAKGLNNRLSARISDFENVLLMVHVVGYMLAPQAHGTQLFFFPTPDFDFFGTFEHSPLHIFFS